MPSKQVSQATFDAIVREAMTDFGLSPSEAVDDAKEQLTKAGVTDLSNLVDPSCPKSADMQDSYVLMSNQLQTAIVSNDFDQARAVLQKFTELDDKAAAVAGANGAIEAVTRVLARFSADETHSASKLLTVTCSAISKFCARNEANRIRFIQQSNPCGVTSLASLLQSFSSDCQRDVSAVNAVLSAVADVQRRCESVKRKFAAGETPDAVLNLLHWSVTQVCEKGQRVDLFGKGSLVARQWMTMDDISATVAETFARARLLSGAKVITESGLRPLQKTRTLTCILEEAIAIGQVASSEIRDGLLRECVLLAKSFAVSDDICREIASRGVGSLAICMLKEKRDEANFVYACLGLLRNLAGRDDCKRVVFDGMRTVIFAVEWHYKSSEIIAEVFCSLVAALSLRRPDIGSLIVSSGSINLVLDAMEEHQDSAKVLKSGCFAIRNAASRNEESRLTLVSSRRAENAVRCAWKKFPRICHDAAYFALDELDVLAEDEMRTDSRYTMPVGFYQRPIARKGR